MERQLKTEYQRDMYHSYLVVAMEDDMQTEYHEKVLFHNEMKGLLSFETRIFDYQKYAYYAINGLQSLSCIFEKKTYSSAQLIMMLEDIMQIIQDGKEFLLKESDYVLSPDKIYLELPKFRVKLCYFPGYNVYLSKQLHHLFEYFMNRIDYNDQTAVVLTYRLYMQSKEEGCTMQQLQDILKAGVRDEETTMNKETTMHKEATKHKEITKHKEPTIDKEIAFDKKLQSEDHIWGVKEKGKLPFVDERIENEKEILYYPMSCYGFMAGAIMIAILLFTVSYKQRFFFNNIKEKPSLVKCMLLLTIMVLVLWYVCKKVFHKNRKMSKIISEITYRNPNIFGGSFNQIYDDSQEGSKESEADISDYEVDLLDIEKNLSVYDINEELENEDETILLSQLVQEKTVKLIPVEKNKYETIVLSEFPFFVGKLKTHMDYNIENDTISRFHAKIIKENETYYLMDLNSTNGTFINGKQLNSEEKARINNGDFVMFANLEYNFYC